MNKYYGIIISLIAGLSTIIGYFFIYVKGNKNNVISKSLSFSGGVMITLSIIDLIPTSIQSLHLNNSLFYSLFYTFVFFITGYFLCKIISKTVNTNNELYEIGIISMIGIILHNIPEGIATYVLSTINLKLGILLAIAIILHNIPEGISISVPIYYSIKNKKKTFLYTFISGISEPVGAILSMLFLYKYIDSNIVGILFSLIAGFMIYIGYNEMVKKSKKYGNNIDYLFYGSLFILVIEIILKLI